VPPEQIAADPVAVVEAAEPLAHPAIPLPCNLYGKTRRNSRGWNLNDPAELEALDAAMAPFAQKQWGNGESRAITNPADRSDIVGHVRDADAAEAKAAVSKAEMAFAAWSSTLVSERAAILERTADLYEENAAELMALAVREAGKTRFDAIAEVREAVDFLRYYAAEAREKLGARNGLGPVVCISPWNFPLAIFTGQVAGSLAAGNSVVAKPAEQTPLIASRAVELFVQAGLPEGVLTLVQGDGARIGPALTGDKRACGIVFTGSTETARLIDISMARNGNYTAPLIAETGGLNAMIIDSTALPEQAVRDILASAFQSAGQRCSALRILFVQKDVAPVLLEMLEGAARELGIGMPWQPATDVGPVIDEEARRVITEHCEKLEAQARLLFRLDLPQTCVNGTFVAPAAFRLDSMKDLKREIFGPVLHVVEYEAHDLDRIVDDINAAGYGLTLGVHSRIDTRIDHICSRAHIGNIYVNRNQIGAVVGVQPFGGEGLSGTGPKAGGPLYLMRLSKPSQGGDITAMPQDASFDTAPRLLPGPTGEKNSYGLRPRGLIACLSPGSERQKEQARLARNAGNTVIATGADDLVFEQALEDDRLAAVMVDGEASRELRIMLAEKKGRRVPVITGKGDLFMLYAESSVSEDTTASGGNASLLAAVS
jgi:RHH-type proline utilization regulon transcriptional repressor/proline dehydrogenase/delta 1-pyrroline-5-carboxylate dehydrogenase